MKQIINFSDVIVSEEPLKPTYIPSDVLFRMEQLRSIAHSMAKRKSNVLLLGGTGVGKTVSANFVANLVMKEYPQERIIYISCGNFNTPKKILTEIATYLNVKQPYRAGESDLISILTKIDTTHLFLIMDEFDKMGITHFSRMVKILETLNLYAAFITNKQVFPNTLEPEIAHRVGWSVERFERYGAEQVYDILKSRTVLAFKPNVVDEEVLRYLSACVVSEHESDVRFGLKALSTAGKLAENQNKDKITKNILDKGIKAVHCSLLLDTIQTLSDTNKLLILTIGYNNYTSSSLYNMYKTLAKKHKIPIADNYVNFWRRLGQLERDYSLIVTQETTGNGSRGGKRKKVYSQIPEELFNEIKPKIEQSLGFTIEDKQMRIGVEE